MIRTTLAAAIVFASVPCSKTATTRHDQETEFKDLFGIAPTSAVTDIRYHVNDSYFSGCTLWMNFTCDPATYETILKANDYKPSKESMIGEGRTGAPAWWPKADPPQAILYSRSQDDTPANEGFQFLEFL
jgi:hypothetical protein